jgi:hypothetical protein
VGGSSFCVVAGQARELETDVPHLEKLADEVWLADHPDK